ncbi:hypothetical protein RFI_08529 [Reticulomyxa filosa]|uniref:Uncharacterized protein n=1 Tax=Reticulomyxa filosa TaxID=46433 RepID=X6NRF4_RETFI|nr:hypothetical protein RFI_08529 [Reticulomyxa filosa]|eukprot:ETO28606.1 hypothetical protein RFI_08529 [Reticulomyxa filosa]
MMVKTLFPSHVNDEGITKGCMLLLKIKRRTGETKHDGNDSKNKDKGGSEDTNTVLKFKCTYQNAITEKEETLVFSAQIPPTAALGHPKDEEWFESHGVRKVIALTHYVNLCRAVVSQQAIYSSVGIPYRYKPEAGNFLKGSDSNKGEELTSQKDILESFKDYFSNQCQLLKDDFMKEEIDVIDKLIGQQKSHFDTKY